VHFSTAKLSPPFKDTSVTYLPTVQPFNVISIVNKRKYFIAPVILFTPKQKYIQVILLG
jgi:hypothetical protein